MGGRPTVYLAGPITGSTFDQASEWRDDVAKYLGVVGIDAFSPLRVKQYLRDQGTLEKQYSGLHPLSDDRGIMTRDRFDVRTRDMVLANFLPGSERVSIGTCIEIGWADAYRKPVVAVMDEANVHRHAMIMEAIGYVVPTLEEAVEIVKAVLLP